MHDCRLLSFDIQPNSLVKYQKWHRAVALSTVFCVPFYAALRKYRKFIRKPLIKSDREMLLGKPPSISQNNFVSASIVQPHYIKHHFTRKKTKTYKMSHQTSLTVKGLHKYLVTQWDAQYEKKSPKCLRVAQMSKKTLFSCSPRSEIFQLCASSVVSTTKMCKSSDWIFKDFSHRAEYEKMMLPFLLFHRLVMWYR